MSESLDTQNKSGSTGWKPGTAPQADAGTTQSLIGPTVVIKGEVTAEEDLMVMGRVEGFIDHSQTVTVHADGCVAAEVKAQEVLVEGTVDGNVYGTKRVQIAESGKVSGNVYAPRVGVLEGASFKGAIDMESDVSVIEKRFQEKTGAQPRTAKGSSAAPEAKAKPDTSTASAQKSPTGASTDSDSSSDSDADSGTDTQARH